MTSAELEQLERRMKQKWHELVLAEQQGASIQVLERMYNMYMLAVEEYNRCSNDHQHEEPAHATMLQEQALDAPPAPLRRKKKAS
jgi:hypothetical protein